MSKELEGAIVSVEAELEETLEKFGVVLGDRFRFVRDAWKGVEGRASNQLVALHARQRGREWQLRADEIEALMDDIREELASLRAWRARGL